MNREGVRGVAGGRGLGREVEGGVADGDVGEEVRLEVRQIWRDGDIGVGASSHFSKFMCIK